MPGPASFLEGDSNREQMEEEQDQQDQQQQQEQDDRHSQISRHSVLHYEPAYLSFGDSFVARPHINDSQFQDSRFNDSQFHESRFNDSQFHESRLNDSHFHESRFNDSHFHESRFNESHLHYLAGPSEGMSTQPSLERVESMTSFSLKKFIHLWPPLNEFPRWYWKRLFGYDQSKTLYGFFPSVDQIITFVFVCISMIVLSVIEYYGFHPLMKNLSIFIPAFGASATVFFCVPKAPLAQPRSFFFAHITASIIGVSMANIFQFVPNQEFGFKCAGAIGVGLHLVLMCITNTVHPPASATCVSAALSPINAYYHDQGFLFVVCPVILGASILFFCAWVLNNLVERRSPYPLYWW